MIKSNFSKQRNIPNITTRKSSPMTTNFAKGIYTYKPNDTMGLDELRLAQDARFDRVGEYGTRKGYMNYGVPLGIATFATSWDDSNQHYVKGSKVKAFTATASESGPICRMDIRLRKKSADAYVVPKLIFKANNKVISTVCVDPSGLSTTFYTHYPYLMDAPSVTSGQTISVELGVQSGNIDDLEVITSPSTDALMVSVKTCTAGGVSNVFEANIDGTITILFTHNGSLYRNSNGSVSKIRDLPAGVTKVRFSQNLNQIRYADGKEGPHVINTSNWSDSAIPVKDLKTDTTLNIQMNNIMPGTADNLIYGVVDPNTEAVWTYPYGYSYAKSPAFSTTATISGNPGTTLTIQKGTITPSGIAVGDWITGQGTATAEVTSISGNNVNCKIVDTTPQVISSYDKFSVDFYQNFPAIKTGDPLTAMFNLGGVLYFMTRRNKYQMYAQTAESWSQSTSNAQNGTFSQESLVCDLNYAYYANDNGIYIFDGSSEASLTENSIQNLYDAIPDKTSMTLDLYQNRLYCFYSDTAGQPNNKCLVYNINLRVWESLDNNAYVNGTCARKATSRRFLCGHSKIGLIMIKEYDRYADMSTPIAFNLETAYQHFGTTSQLKRITKWRPEFAVSDKPYTCECGYALDFTDQVKYAFSIDLQRQEAITADYVWDNPSNYGVPAMPTIHTTIPQVNGEFYRCQIRYQHIAAFEPVIFRSHTLTVQTQRIR